MSFPDRPISEAWKVLQLVPPTLPIDVYGIALALGVYVHEPEFEDHVSGMLLQQNNQTIIAVNAKHAPTRKRFSIAHELGHYCLHNDASKLFVDQAVIFFRDDKSSDGNDFREREANRFAAELLMPRKLVEQQISMLPLSLYDDDTAVRILADKFAVSVMAMTIRLQTLGYVTHDKPY